MRILTLLLAAGAAFGSIVELLIVLLQLDGDTCGYFAEATCDPEDLRFDFDAALSLTGLVLSLSVVSAGLACLITGRKTLWWATVVCFSAAAMVGIALEVLDIPNR